MIYTTRLAYLRRALTQAFNDEILFVGSGGIFELADQATARANVHRELIDLIRQRKGPLRQQPGVVSGLISQTKHLVKRLLGRPHGSEIDLYDVGEWTVWSSNDDSPIGT